MDASRSSDRADAKRVEHWTHDVVRVSDKNRGGSCGSRESCSRVAKAPRSHQDHAAVYSGERSLPLHRRSDRQARVKKILLVSAAQLAGNMSDFGIGVNPVPSFEMKSADGRLILGGVRHPKALDRARPMPSVLQRIADRRSPRREQLLLCLLQLEQRDVEEHVGRSRRDR
jgi:hypothetical protein